jgi:hypothetical protein
MTHEIHAVTGFEKVAPFTLRVHFEDGTAQTINFSRSHQSENTLYFVLKLLAAVDCVILGSGL